MIGRKDISTASRGCQSGCRGVRASIYARAWHAPVWVEDCAAGGLACDRLVQHGRQILSDLQGRVKCRYRDHRPRRLYPRRRPYIPGEPDACQNLAFAAVFCRLLTISVFHILEVHHDGRRQASSSLTLVEKCIAEQGPTLVYVSSTTRRHKYVHTCAHTIPSRFVFCPKLLCSFGGQKPLQITQASRQAS